MVKRYSGQFDEKIISGIRQNKLGKLNGDNLDIRVKPSEERGSTIKQETLHMFLSNFVFDRIDTTLLDNTTSLGDYNNISINKFLLNSDEKDQLYHFIAKHLANDFSSYFKSCNWLRIVTKEFQEHQLK